MTIRSKIIGLFLLPGLWSGAMPGSAQSLCNEKGEVCEARVTSGHPWFAQMAIDAALQWKYMPLLVKGEAKPFTTAIVFPFHY